MLPLHHFRPPLLLLTSLPIALFAVAPHYLTSLFPTLQSYLPWVSATTSTYCYRDGVDTFDDAGSTHSCFRVLQDGTFGEIFTPPKEDENKYQWREGTVMPGLWDGHGHILDYGAMLHSVQLYGAKSLEEVRSRIKAYIRQHPGVGTKEHWIKGIGWDQRYFNSTMPSSSDLSSDPALKDLYIMLDRVDVHCTWVSSAVLSLLPSSPRAPPGGTIPTTGVFCDNAMDLPLSVFPQPSQSQLTERFLATQKSLHSFGIVGVHDAGVLPEAMISLYNSPQLSSRPTLRTYAMIECAERNTYCTPPNTPYVSDHLVIRSVKLFADGALGSWGAALLEPYSDKPEELGTLLIQPEALKKVAGEWYAAGYQVNIHAIGDRAVRVAVAALRSALATECKGNEDDFSCLSAVQRWRRLRLEHSQIVSLEDQKLMQKLGIIPSVQPTHATSDSAYAEQRLGKKRLKERAYRMKTFLDMGLGLVFGSDFPVESPDVVAGVIAAVERIGAGGTRWYGDEAVQEREAWWAFTRGPAYAAGLEGMAGVVAKGAWADWIVIDKGRRSVWETWVGGKRVFRKGKRGGGAEERASKKGEEL